MFQHGASFTCRPLYVQGTSTLPFLWIHFSFSNRNWPNRVTNRRPLFPNFFRKRIAFPPRPLWCPVVQRTLGCFLRTQPPCEREKLVLFALCALLPASSSLCLVFHTGTLVPRPP